MSGRHTTVGIRRWAPNARHAALACAPIAAVLIALGAGGAGVVTGRAEIAATAGAAGAAGVLLEQARSRAARRRLREERSRLRRQAGDLELQVGRLRRELAAVPVLLSPGPRPAAAGLGPIPVIEAFGRAAEPATPRSLPILTAHRRGLQSTIAGDQTVSQLGGHDDQAGSGVPAWPLVPTWLDGPLTRRDGVPAAVPPLPVGLPPLPAAAGVGLLLPAQRPPATPITGLTLPAAEIAGLSLPAAAPAVSELDAGGIPVLAPGPAEPLAAAAGAGAPGGAEDEQVPDDAEDVVEDVASDPGVVGSMGVGGELDGGELDGGEVFDLRAYPARDSLAELPLTAPELDAMVYAAMARQDADSMTLALEFGSEGLFEPRVTTPPGERTPDEIARLAADARAVARALRGSVTPSPFFTAGAFDVQSLPGDQPSTETAGRHTA